MTVIRLRARKKLCGLNARAPFDQADSLEPCLVADGCNGAVEAACDGRDPQVLVGEAPEFQHFLVRPETIPPHHHPLAPCNGCLRDVAHPARAVRPAPPKPPVGWSSVFLRAATSCARRPRWPLSAPGLAVCHGSAAKALRFRPGVRRSVTMSPHNETAGDGKYGSSWRPAEPRSFHPLGIVVCRALCGPPCAEA